MAQLRGFETLEARLIPTSAGCSIHAHYTPTDRVSLLTHKDGPVLVFLHGYPQSKFIWRHILPSFTGAYRTFVADLPGYGESTPLPQTNRRLVGASILEALATVYPDAPIMLIGHDRGARTWQKTSTDFSNQSSPAFASYPQAVRELKLLGTMIIDIVPYITQWGGFANPRVATGYFHWPFLATGPLAHRMIQSYGGGKFCTDLLAKSAETATPAAAASFKSDDSFAHYAAYFEKESVCQAAIDDYVAGAEIDVDEQREDIAAGRKINVPVVVQCSAKNLGRTFDLQKVWGEWCTGKLSVEGIEGGIGHYIPEEAPETVITGIRQLLEFVSAN